MHRGGKTLEESGDPEKSDIRRKRQKMEKVEVPYSSR